MLIAALILLILGGLILWSSGMAIAYHKSDEEEPSLHGALDEIFLGGVFSFPKRLERFCRVIGEGLRNHDTTARSLVVLLGVGLGMLLLSGLLWIFAET